ncbi:choice-of-anchor B domain-containing protein [Prauserella shujinwangii]|uniref:Choice-of-anchor B domain-containing protein n=1 Tax=Prauserella shujinwangii TaxID=1453103 RepID=A0A2T0LKH8_9PSEU|nr:choice-of-anchor B family protein [Prauserella shujinwangii]PRX43394.1 choice-of-anchor B domain-containing protein [Prauserella shujinwangii]
MRAILATATIAVLAAVLSAPAASAHEQAFDQVSPPTAEERRAELTAAPDGQAKCVNGVAADTYACDGIDMLDHLWLEDLGLSFANDMWGWTDPATGRDYAIIGGTEGTVFVDISEPTDATVVGMLPAHVLDPNRPFWRDIKVHDNHAFVVSEQIPHGMQVFDLTRLRTETGTFTEDAHYPLFGNAHNININTDSGYAYVIGTNTCAGGLHMVDVSTPTSPEFAGCFATHGYIHDTQCVTYSGPDADYAGREICLNSNAANDGNFVSIVDVTDKLAPRPIARVPYTDSGYSHQGWLTPDQRYFLHGDELDELDHGINTRTRIWDMSDLDNPRHIGSFDNGTTSIDHNIYTERRLAYASNYTSGLRVYHTGKIADGELKEVAHFDVYPENDNASFEGGTWSNYGYFKRDVIGVSTMDRGLFILRLR